MDKVIPRLILTKVIKLHNKNFKRYKDYTIFPIGTSILSQAKT